MLKKTITYKDYNDVERTEDVYFNLTEVEFTGFQMELRKQGLDLEFLMKAPDANGADLLGLFKEIILMAYGEKSDDGRYFNKLDADGRRLSIPFSQSAAYYAVLNDITSSVDSVRDFVVGIMPSEIRKAVADGKIDLTQLPAPQISN